MNNINKKNKYNRITKLTKLKSDGDIDILINRSVGYFRKIMNYGKLIHKGQILDYFFILEDMINIQDNKNPKIIYGTKNKIIVEYGEKILLMRFKKTYSYNMIVRELRTKYKKGISRTMIFNFIELNKKEWDEYFEFS